MNILTGTLSLPMGLMRKVRSYLTASKGDHNVSQMEAQTGKELLYVPGKFAQLEHGRTHYLLLGPETGKLVVFSHGVSLFSFVWLDLARKLAAEGCRVLLYDFYGHGFSSIPSCQYTIELFCCQLEQLMDYLGLLQGREERSIVLIGHSMGGFVSSEIAARYKDLVSHLVLFNVVGIPVKLGLQHPFPSALQIVAHVVRKTSLFDRCAHVLAKFISYHTKMIPVTYEELCNCASSLDEERKRNSGVRAHALKAPVLMDEIPSESSSTVYSRISAAVASLTPQHALSFAKSVQFLYKTWMFQVAVNADRSRVLLAVLRDCPLLDADHSSTYRFLGNTILPHEVPNKFVGVRDWSRKLPVLILWGLNDRITPPSLLDDYLRYIPHARIVRLSDGDHSLFLQRPDSVYQEVANFVRKGSIVQEL